MSDTSSTGWDVVSEPNLSLDERIVAQIKVVEDAIDCQDAEEPAAKETYSLLALLRQRFGTRPLDSISAVGASGTMRSRETTPSNPSHESAPVPPKRPPSNAASESRPETEPRPKSTTKRKRASKAKAAEVDWEISRPKANSQVVVNQRKPKPSPALAEHMQLGWDAIVAMVTASDASPKPEPSSGAPPTGPSSSNDKVEKTERPEFCLALQIVAQAMVAKMAWAEEARYIKASQRQWCSDTLAMQIYSEGWPDEGEGEMVSVEEVKEREPIPFLKSEDADSASTATAPDVGLKTHSRLKEALEGEDISLLDDQLKFQLRLVCMGLAWCGFSLDTKIATHSLILLLKKKLKWCQAERDRGGEFSAYEALENIKLFFAETNSGAEFPSAFFEPLAKEFEPKEDTSEWLDIFEWNVHEELEEMIELCEGTHIDSPLTPKKLRSKLKQTYMALQHSFNSVKDFRKVVEERRAKPPTFSAAAEADWVAG